MCLVVQSHLNNNSNSKKNTKQKKQKIRNQVLGEKNDLD